jgi:hypothetical protein
MAHSSTLRGSTHPGKTARAVALAIAGNLALAAVVAASQGGPGYLAVDSWSKGAPSPNTVRLAASTGGAIPKQPDDFIGANAIVGIAWADLDTGTALVATIHPVIGRDSNQRPHSWHLHTVQLGGGATAPNDFCLVEVLTTPTGGISIQGDTLTVRLNAAALPDAGSGPISVDDLDAAVGFTVHSGDTGCATGLGVRVMS